MKRATGYLVIFACYLFASLAGLGLFCLVFNDGDSVLTLLAGLFVLDITATLVVWMYGLIFKNSSFYDPYWSLMPWLIILFVMLRLKYFSATNIIVLCVLGIWSFRLTINWAITCKSIKTEDWRYVQYRQNNTKLMWHIINLFGINLVPTILVFLGLTPAILLVVENAPFNPLIIFGAAVVLLGTVFELLSDIAIHRFKKQRGDKGEVLNKGLWKYSRHPNYLGEILVWFGVYLMALFVVPKLFYTAFGFISIFLLFWFISIPLMEKRQLKRREGYKEYTKTTSKLFLLPNKKKEEN